MYVALWFYIATIVTVAMLHIFNNLCRAVTGSRPVRCPRSKKLPGLRRCAGRVHAVVVRPQRGGVLPDHAVPRADVLLPAQGGQRPVFSYRLSIIHFWSLVFIYIWAGPHHLHYTALPEWASTLGMLFSVMLWMPSWGGMINGLLTLRGAWNKVAQTRSSSSSSWASPSTACHVRGPDALGQERQRPEPLHGLDHRPRARAARWAGTASWPSACVLADAAALPDASCGARSWRAHFWIGTIGILLYIIADLRRRHHPGPDVACVR
jgi:cytochrome c oxidase cbb3-type subunit I/II